jgi:hypothetical protein
LKEKLFFLWKMKAIAQLSDIYKYYIYLNLHNF